VKSLARGFLAGFGFALGASVAGTLIGYTIGKLGEGALKRFYSPDSSEPDSSLVSPSSTPSDEPEQISIDLDELRETGQTRIKGFRHHSADYGRVEE